MVKEKNMVILHRCELIWTSKAHTAEEVRPDTFLTLALCTSVLSFMLRLLYPYYKSPNFPTMLGGSQSQSGQWWQKRIPGLTSHWTRPPGHFTVSLLSRPTNTQHIWIMFYLSQALLHVSMHLHHLQGILTLYFTKVTKL
jgi:hypothetical protein